MDCSFVSGAQSSSPAFPVRSLLPPWQCSYWPCRQYVDGTFPEQSVLCKNKYPTRHPTHPVGKVSHSTQSNNAGIHTPGHAQTPMWSLNDTRPQSPVQSCCNPQISFFLYWWHSWYKNRLLVPSHYWVRALAPGHPLERNSLYWQPTDRSKSPCWQAPVSLTQFSKK